MALPSVKSDGLTHELLILPRVVVASPYALAREGAGLAAELSPREKRSSALIDTPGRGKPPAFALREKRTPRTSFPRRPPRTVAVA